MLGFRRVITGQWQRLAVSRVARNTLRLWKQVAINDAGIPRDNSLVSETSAILGLKDGRDSVCLLYLCDETLKNIKQYFTLL